MERQTIFITGGSGYIGVPTAYALHHLGFRIVIFDIKQFPKKISGMEEATGDIRNEAHLKSAMKVYTPDLVIHLAALTSVADSEKNQKSYHEINVRGTRNVLSAMHTVSCQNLIFASSSAVYKESERKMAEDSPIAPLSFYGKTKEEAEHLIQKEKGLHYGILRYFNVVGITEDRLFGESIENNLKLIPSALRVGLGKQKNLYIYGNAYPTPDGTAIRDYVSLEDVVRANVLTVQYLLAFPESKKFRFRECNAICNIGSGQGTSNLEVVHLIEQITKKKIPVVYKKARRETVVSIADITKANNMLEWKPKKSRLQDIIQNSNTFMSFRPPSRNLKDAGSILR